MMPGWGWFLIGCVTGATLGALAVALVAAAKLAEMFDPFDPTR